ncbi:SEC-C domain protein [Pararhodospirillum photometricum DSM 122]|uniref:SEC-C domain protein n=1 Tax=Pararhodospirillum photometricum DSM 122 TaxID=1150469 RepID=H6SKE9_PARPM|nr:SEC-C domain protein [Pararhodospirillum photometricum DSM 122]
MLAGAPAPTAEALMRSRYTAYCRGDIDYLLRTMTEEARQDIDPEEARTVSAQARWDGLDVRATEAGGPDDDDGVVEYVARFRLNGQTCLHHERAFFTRVDGQWRVSGGEVNPKAPPRRVASVGRNDPCPCGSRKKIQKVLRRLRIRGVVGRLASPAFLCFRAFSSQ